MTLYLLMISISCLALSELDGFYVFFFYCNIIMNIIIIIKLFLYYFKLLFSFFINFLLYLPLCDKEARKESLDFIEDLDVKRLKTIKT